MFKKVFNCKSHKQDQSPELETTDSTTSDSPGMFPLILCVTHLPKMYATYLDQYALPIWTNYNNYQEYQQPCIDLRLRS